MNNAIYPHRATCSICGLSYLKKGDWQKTCGPCYYKHDTKGIIKSLEQQVNQLTKQLRNAQTQPKQTVASNALTPELLKNIIHLCHPDKHGGSKVANDVTAALLKLRK